MRQRSSSRSYRYCHTLVWSRGRNCALSADVPISEIGKKRIASNAEHLNLLGSVIVASLLMLLSIRSPFDTWVDLVRLISAIMGGMVALRLFNLGSGKFYHFGNCVEGLSLLFPPR